ITTRHSGQKKIYQVRVEHVLLAGTEFLDAEPPARLAGDRLVWELGDLEPGFAQPVKVRVQPRDGARGLAGGTALFQILFSRQPAAGPSPEVEIAETLTAPATPPPAAPRAELRLSLTGPEQATLQEEIAYRLELHNPGAAPADAVRVTCSLPDELQFAAAD